jgi:hypothetical protein
VETQDGGDVPEEVKVLDLIREEAKKLIDLRTRHGLSPDQQARYDELLEKEKEILRRTGGLRT